MQLPLSAFGFGHEGGQGVEALRALGEQCCFHAVPALLERNPVRWHPRKLVSLHSSAEAFFLLLPTLSKQATVEAQHARTEPHSERLKGVVNPVLVR